MTNKLKKLVALFMALVLTIGIMSGYTSSNVVRAEEDGQVEITADKDNFNIKNISGSTLTDMCIVFTLNSVSYMPIFGTALTSNNSFICSTADILKELDKSYGIFNIKVEVTYRALSNCSTSKEFTFVNLKAVELKFDESTKILSWDSACPINLDNNDVFYQIYVNGYPFDMFYNTQERSFENYNFISESKYTILVSSYINITATDDVIIISNYTKSDPIIYEAPSDTTNTENDSSEETDTTQSENNTETETTESTSSSSSDSSNNDSPASDSSSDDSDSSSSETNTHQPSVGDSQGWDKIDNEINKVLSAPATTDGLKVLNVSLTNEDYLPESVISAVAKSGVIMSVRLNEDIVVNIDGSELDAYDATFTKFSIDDSSDYSTFIVNTAGKNLLKTITIFRRFPSQLIGHTVSLYFIDANGERITFATSPVYANGYAAFKIPFVHAKYHIAID